MEKKSPKGVSVFGMFQNIDKEILFDFFFTRHHRGACDFYTFKSASKIKKYLGQCYFFSDKTHDFAISNKRVSEHFMCFNYSFIV